MRHERLPDCRPTRPSDDVTSASSYPELICGEFVMRPRVIVRLSCTDIDAIGRWRRRMVLAIVVVATLAVLSVYQRPIDARSPAPAGERASVAENEPGR